MPIMPNDTIYLLSVFVCVCVCVEVDGVYGHDSVCADPSQVCVHTCSGQPEVIVFRCQLPYLFADLFIY